jgi:hypothetical protein
MSSKLNEKYQDVVASLKEDAAELRAGRAHVSETNALPLTDIGPVTSWKPGAQTFDVPAPLRGHVPNDTDIHDEGSIAALRTMHNKLLTNDLAATPVFPLKPVGYPFATICYLTISYWPPGESPIVWKNATGVLVGPRHVLTSSDAIPWAQTALVPGTKWNMKITPALWDTGSLSIAAPETYASEAEGWPEGSSAATGPRRRYLDMAMCRTSSPIGLIQGHLGNGLAFFLDTNRAANEGPWYSYNYDALTYPFRPKLQVMDQIPHRLVEQRAIVFNNGEYVGDTWAADMTADDTSLGGTVIAYRHLTWGDPNSPADWFPGGVISGQGVDNQGKTSVIIAGGASLLWGFINYFINKYP